jgi:cellulose synthase/poly-beta-1,6-N-acetylglucosamine synthase-like glycosyltransferase
MISVVIISKDEPGIDETLADVSREVDTLSEPCEVVVVDASDGRLDYIRDRHAALVRWIDFRPPPGARVSIPHQRNAGVREARGDIIVFTDAGCRPGRGWLASLLAPLLAGEDVVAGAQRDPSGRGLMEARRELRPATAGQPAYLAEAPTINLAFYRQVFDKVGGFDENLAYGSDMDFSWRVVESGYRVRYSPEAVVEHDWGTSRRQRHRQFIYGKARARLYRKHRSRLKRVLRNDPIVVVNPLLLLGMPIALIFPPYLLLLLVPARACRYHGRWGVVRAVPDQLWFGAGVLAELATERVYAGYRGRSVPTPRRMAGVS